jgi:acetyl-CoA carboxylase carboxyl transferase subunit alpha
MPLGGDRYYGDDQAIIGGFARLNGRRVMLIGHEKGNDTQSRIKHNFGMGKPEGYRKAIRLMELAGRFGLPVVTLGRYLWRVPGRRSRRARSGRGDCPFDRGLPCALPVPMVAGDRG